MVFVVCGLNHKTASLPLREKMAQSPELQKLLLTRLLQEGVAFEAMMLSTCNRTEFYYVSDQPDLLREWLAHYHQLSPLELMPSLYLYTGDEALEHCLRVACGLDSMMLGEPQILGQMKSAFKLAESIGTIGSIMQMAFQHVFSASKKIRHSSGIGNNPISIAYLSAQVVKRLHPSNASLTILLIGAGETTSLVAKYLSKQSSHHFIVASRTLDGAKLLAEKVQGIAVTTADIPEVLPKADVIVTATTCPLPFINKNLVQHSLERRQFKPMCFLDLAVPRDIEADVAELEQVQLFNIDDLQQQIESGMNERRAAALQAEKLIALELENYVRKHRSLQANTLICDYQDQMNVLAGEELERALRKLEQGYNHQDVLQEFAQRLVSKLAHSPLVGLKQAASDGRTELLDLAEYLFNPLSLRLNHEKVT